MDLLEYREYYLNQIKATAIEEKRYPYEVFIDSVEEIMISDWSFLSSLEQHHFSVPTGNVTHKSMLIHAGSVDVPTNTVNLLVADDGFDEITSINNRDVQRKVELMRNFFENTLKGYFKNAEDSNPAVQFARRIFHCKDDIYKIRLFFISANKLSDRVKNIELEDLQFDGKSYKVELDIIDIVKIYNAGLADTEKEDIVFNISDFGVDGIPCIRADIGAENYESYLAVVPGEFLSNIYKKFGSRLLEGNVRSFLQVRGGVNKGIRNTILNERNNFFSYNNGVSTTAKNIVIENIEGKGLCITQFTDLQIINGGQTTASLASASIKDKAVLEGIYVQMKLTVVENMDSDFIRKISMYANSQNKVTAADINSNHPFYLRIEEFSRKIYAPAVNGQTYQTMWFFERSRGQYEQPKMKMTKAERASYERVHPTKQKFSKTDLAKYINADELKPYFVVWGAEVNATRFQQEMEKQWESDISVYNELYYKDLIAKAILFTTIRKAVLTSDWY